jgi:hypothetical protein
MLTCSNRLCGPISQYESLVSWTSSKEDIAQQGTFKVDPMLLRCLMKESCTRVLCSSNSFLSSSSRCICLRNSSFSSSNCSSSATDSRSSRFRLRVHTSYTNPLLTVCVPATPVFLVNELTERCPLRWCLPLPQHFGGDVVSKSHTRCLHFVFRLLHVLTEP